MVLAENAMRFYLIMNVFRFLYLNIFAIFLVVLSILIFLIPINNIVLNIIRYFYTFLFAVSGIGIFTQWKTRKRRLKILVAKNSNELRLDTFEQYRETLCGLLIADIALRDLKKKEYYKYYTKTNWKKIRRAAFGLKKKKMK